jgi:protein arginine N-methyltransferase 1
LSLIVDEHREYLADQARISAFRKAIHEVVRAGDVVLDLGAGTGIMGLLACEAGAQRVYSIESGGMIEVARSLCRAIGFEDRVTFIKGHSLQIDLPEKVDVVVADQIGRLGFEAGVLDYFRDARERFLKPGGQMIPRSIELIVAPVECTERWENVDFWNNTTTGFDLSPVRRWAVNTGYPVSYSPDQLLGSPAVGASLDLSSVAAAPFKLEASILVERAGTLHGIGGWFRAQLSEHAVLTNSPLAAERINRRNVFFPIDRAVSVVEGDRVHIVIHIMPTDLIVTWTAEVWEKTHEGSDICKGRFTQSTWQGMLIVKEALHLTRPDSVPQLSPRGHARLTVLRLCDGHHTLAEVEQEVYRSHLQLFPSAREAAVFVAEVVTRYAATPHDAIPDMRSDS